MVINLSVRLEKHQTIEILLMVDVYTFLKKIAFSIFLDFWNSSVAHEKIINCTLFYQNTVDQT